MDNEDINSFEKLEEKRTVINNHKMLCEANRDEIENQNKKLRLYLESIDNSYAICSKDMSVLCEKAYESIDKTNRALYRLEEELSENFQQENRKIMQYEEEIRKNDERKPNQD